MKSKFFRGISLFAMMLLLAGCSEAEGLMDSVEGLVKSIDELVQSETSKEKETSDGTTETGEVAVSKEEKTEAEEQEQVGEDPASMFGDQDEEGAVSPDYFSEVSPYYDLYEGEIDPANGYFLPIYDDWTLVSVIEDGSNDMWKGKFCHNSDPYRVASQYFADIENLGLTIQNFWYEDDGQETDEGFDYRRFAYYYGADYDGVIEGLNLQIDGKIEFFTDSRGEYCAVSTFTIIQ